MTSNSRRPIAGALAAAMLMLGTCVPLASAQARDRDAAIAAGAIGGLALGAVLGGALASPPPPPPVDYGPPPPRRVYVLPPEDCGYRRVRVYDEDGEFAGYKRVPAC